MHSAINRLTTALVVAAVALSACGSVEPTPTGSTDPALPPGDDTAPEPTQPVADGPSGRLQYDPEVLRAELELARATWEQKNWPSYRYRYTPVCFCERELLEAHVIDGKLVDDTGDPRLRSIEGWFDTIEQAIGTAHDVQVDYDEWGYPGSVYIDVDADIADEEFGLEFDGWFHVPDAVDTFMPDEYPCGYGFSAATPAQSVSFQVFFGPSDEPESGTYDLADADVGTVEFGADLMANWCDDVFEPGEPEPRVDERWTLVGGTVTITIEGQQATGEFSDIVALTPAGVEYPLGAATIVNEGWGMFAG